MDIHSSSHFNTFLFLGILSGIFYPLVQTGVELSVSTICVKCERKPCFLDLFFFVISLTLNLLTRRNSGCKSLFFEGILFPECACLCRRRFEYGFVVWLYWSSRGNKRSIAKLKGKISFFPELPPGQEYNKAEALGFFH